MLIYVGSLEYSPVYKSLCFAFGNAVEREGHNVQYLFSKKYSWMLQKGQDSKVIYIGSSEGIFIMILDTMNPRNIMTLWRSVRQDRPTHVYLHNYHLLNHIVALLCRRYKSNFIYHVHEPYVENKSAHGSLQHYWLYIYEFMEKKLLHDADIAIVSSKEASRLFDKRYPWFKGKKVEIPLMYDDLGRNINHIDERKYITFVGPLVPAKGPETFLRIVDYSAKHNLNWSFLLISRSKIDDQNLYGRNNLEIYHSKRISDEEFGYLINKSLVVLTPYKRETQSAVILASYMYGTPVVSSNIGGLPEFVSHKKTGYLVDKDAPIEEWIKGIGYTIENFHNMSVNCRNYFIECFSGKNWNRYINDIFV